MQDDEELVRVPADSAAAADRARFLVQTKSFSQQFAAIYYARLKMLRANLTAVAKREKANDPSVLRVCDKTLEIVKGEKCIIIGTLYKEMDGKPTIMDEYKEKTNEAKPEHYRGDSDHLLLEDDEGRVQLSGGATQSMVTGVIAAIKGCEGEGGVFEVEEMYFPSPVPQPTLPEGAGKGRFVVLVSGLQFGDPKNNPLPTQMFVDYVTGFLGGSQDQHLAASIERIIIAGNSLHRPKGLAESQASYRAKKSDKNEMMVPLKEFDLFLTQMAASSQVDVMAGASDPSNFTLPQQPLHPCLFPSSRTYSTMTTQTNPCLIRSGDFSLLGSSGQNLDDLVLYSDHDRMTLLESTLRWRVIAPSAPDTLGCYPFQNDDPFVITESPHVYFAGNQPEFQSKLVEGSGGRTRLVLVPDFSTTHTCVLVNLETLDAFPLTFSAPAAQATAASATA